jgi:hypothetical protein
MADAHGALQPQHVAGVEDIAYQAVILAQIKPAFVTGDNTRRILSTMLQNGETVIQILVYVFRSDNTDYAAHLSTPLTNSRFVRAIII